MSSYGAIGIDYNDTEPLVTEEPPLPRSASTSQIGREQYSNRRQPYMFTGGIGLSREGSTQSLNEDDDFRDHNMALRYRFYNRLDPGGSQLRMPDHVTQELFSILPFDELKDASGKQSSIITIFSIWNTIMGSSLLAMPWALQQAGLVLGVFLFLFMAGICMYTAILVVESPKNIPDLCVDPAIAEFSDICKHFYGKIGQAISVIFSVVVFLGGIIVYWVLMSNFLYYTGSVVYEALQPNSSTIPIMENKTFTCDVYCPTLSNYDRQLYLEETSAMTSNSWDYSHLWQLQGTVPFYLAVFTFPLFNFKSPTFFTKFNVLGTISVIYLLIFTGSKFFECGINVNFTNPLDINYVKLVSWKFPALTGTLTLSYFIHNAIRTILRNQKNPENNVRDLTIAYFLCAGCYIYIALTFFLSFPVQRSCISDNFLNNYGTGDILSSTARLFLLFQMITVLPLLMYLIRNQLYYTICGDPYPGTCWVVLLNLVIMSIAIGFAVFYPKVGSILRYVGALCGLVYVFTLPNLIHMRKLHMAGQLTLGRRLFHCSLIAIGALNLLAQIFV